MEIGTLRGTGGVRAAEFGLGGLALSPLPALSFSVKDQVRGDPGGEMTESGTSSITSVNRVSPLLAGGGGGGTVALLLPMLLTLLEEEQRSPVDLVDLALPGRLNAYQDSLGSSIPLSPGGDKKGSFKTHQYLSHRLGAEAFLGHTYFLAENL